MQRLNVQDSLFVSGEATGWPLHMGSLAVYDPSTSPEGLTLERVCDLYRERLPILPVFRHKIVRVPGALDRPVFVEDPRIDVADHIHAVRVPEPGTDEQLAELVADLYTPAIDTSGPLWEVWVIEGLRDGRVALFTRTHHAAVDGIRGMEIQAATYDVEADAPLARPGSTHGAGSDVPGPLRLLGGAAVRLAGTPVRMVRTVGHLTEATGRLVGVAGRHESAGLALPLTAPHTSLNQAISSRRGLAFCTLPHGPVKKASRREGVTVNDVVLSVMGGALRRYLQQRGELPDRPLTAGVPIGLSSDDVSPPIGGNRWQVMVTTLATDVADPVERLRRIARSADAGKAVLQAIGPELWQDVIDMPPALLSVIARSYAGLGLTRVHPAVVNVVLSSLRGATFPLYFAGARMVANYPMGPIADGMGLNMTVISYQDSLDFGLTFCPDIVEEPWKLVDALEAEAAELARRYRRPISRGRKGRSGPDLTLVPPARTS